MLIAFPWYLWIVVVVVVVVVVALFAQLLLVFSNLHMAHPEGSELDAAYNR